MNPKHIIALSGRGSIGKTRTLRMVIDLLNGVDLSYEKRDARTTCHYHGKTICVTTPGDNGAEISKNIDYINANPCDIAIMATRTKGATVSTLINYAEQIDAPIIWIRKTYESGDENTINERYARQIVNEVNGLLS